jgi:diguanylate cyclase (GGDEF)-like protein
MQLTHSNIAPTSQKNKGQWPQRFTNPSSVLRLGILIALVMVISQALGFALQNGHLDSLYDEAMALASSLLASAGLAFGAFHSHEKSPKLQRTWHWLTAAGLCWAVGDLAALITVATTSRLPFPSLATIFYLLVYPCLLFGIKTIPEPRRTNAQIVESILDMAIIILSAALIFWNYLIGPIITSGHADRFNILVTAAFPVADVILLWAAFILITFKLTTQPRQSLWVLFTALAAMITLDIMIVYRTMTGIDQHANILHMLKIISPLLLMIAGLVQAVVFQRYRQQPVPTPGISKATGLEYVRLLLPYCWFGCAFGALYFGPSSLEVISPLTMFAWVAAILGIVILRQWVVTRENQNLALQLHQLNADLEQLFVERTAALIRTNEELRREVFERDRMERLLRERDDKLVYFSFHDTLTGLPNRALLIERLSQALRRVKRQDDYHFAVLYLDFDGFKYINDSLGHQAGDYLLSAIARRLEDCVRELDTVARLGGDEFVIVADGICQDDDALVAVKRVQDMLIEPFELEGHRVFMSASIGVVIGDGSYDQATDILRDADLAMYQAKASGKSRFVIFSQEMRISALNRLILENDMRTAMKNGEIFIHYQPILSLDKNQLMGFEALLRWNHPDHGSIPPSDFIPVAESSGLIVPITEWTLWQACGQLKAWIDEFHPEPELTISINLSAIMFSEPDLALMIQRVLEETGLPPRNLKLEITETSIVEDAEAATRMLQACRTMGVQVDIDDFGTGYSALSYLHQFPIDTLKIDRAFIGRIQEDGGNTEVVRTIIALARELNLEVIAEGVETEAQYDYLKKLGCQSGQGFFIARPLAPVDARAMIADRYPKKPGNE